MVNKLTWKEVNIWRECSKKVQYVMPAIIAFDTLCKIQSKQTTQFKQVHH